MEDALTTLLLSLDALPALEHVGAGLDRCLAEHMWVTTDEFVGDALGDVGEVAGANLARHQRENEGLKQQVAELVDQFWPRWTSKCHIGQLVGLLNRVLHDRRGRLLSIPRALAAKPYGDLPQAAKRHRGSACR